MKKYLFEQYTGTGQFIQQRIVSQSSFESSINQIFNSKSTNNSSFYVTSVLHDDKLIIKVVDTPLFQKHTDGFGSYEIYFDAHRCGEIHIQEH